MTDPAAAVAPPRSDGAVTFAEALVAWQLRAGRHDLPWQRTVDPYRIWVSEIMLQQTQVSTVLGYYACFLDRFPSLQALAEAPTEEVLRHWSGLGYYSRARNLHQCARELVANHEGSFPRDPQALAALPGIGRSTAAAIAVFAWQVRAAILDGNVKRVLCRVFGVEGLPSERTVEVALWRIAERELPADGMVPYTQGLMDLGATVCTRRRPRCDACPVSGRCVALATGRVDALPTARPPRQILVRRCELLLVLGSDRVLLEHRPSPGIWGGLYSLPEWRAPQVAPSHPPPQTLAAQIDAWAQTRLAHGVGPATVHGELRHAFTHFRLHARIWRIEVGQAAGQAGQAESSGRAGDRWLPLADAPQAALPRPIKTLLAALD